MKPVKIYGERNSGNIYLEWLLKKNLNIELLDTPEMGWKHRMAPQSDELSDDSKKNVLFLCLIKNPYSWLLSMHKRPYNHESLRKLNFSEFLKYSFGDYRNPVVMWNLKNKSYLKMGDYVEQQMMIKYEDLLKDIASSLNKITDRFNLEKPVMYKNINNLLTHSHGIKSQKFHIDHYLEEKWKKSLFPHHVEFINRYLDRELMETFNYEYL